MASSQLESASIPDLVREIIVTRPGGHDMLRVRERPLALPRDRQVLVRVRACGINFADVAVRLGVYPAVKKNQYPICPGFEFAGEVLAVGPEVRGFKAGDCVFGIIRFGAYTSHVLIEEDYLWPCPAGWSLEECAGFPAVFFTAQHAIRRVARVEKGETALIHSAAGGVGLALTQLLKIHGLRTVGVVGSAKKAQVCLAFGIDRVVVRDGGREWAELESLSARGYDVIFDANGGPSLLEGYKRLAPAGRLVVYGAATMLERGSERLQWVKLGAKYLRRPTFDPLRMVSDNKGVLGFNVVYLFQEKDHIESLMRELLDLIGAGRVKPLPTRSFPFQDVSQAHQAIESGDTVGKLVLNLA